jgi:hypothetical protein
MATSALNAHRDFYNIESHVLKMAITYVDQSAFIPGTARPPLLFKWSAAILSCKFILEIFKQDSVDNLPCLPRLDKFKILHCFGILCVNIGNLSLGKEAVKAARNAIPPTEDFTEAIVEIEGDLENFKGKPKLMCGICSESENARTCSKCHFISYCSRECQVVDWTTHKINCSHLSEVGSILWT